MSSNSFDDDRRLLEGIADRDPEAFRLLMERWAGPITNLAFRFLESRPDAEEAAQDLFLRLYEHPPHLDEHTRLFTWLYRVAVNLCLDRLRRRRRAPPTVSLDLPAEEGGEETLGQRLSQPGTSTPREQAAQTELAAAVRRAVAVLPAGLRAPLVLATFDELSHESIGRILRLSPKAVERRLARARSLLKARLQPYL